MLRDRKELEENLINPIKSVKKQKKIVNDIKKHLNANNDLMPGFVQGVINNAEKELPELDTRVLMLITEQIYAKTSDPNINPEQFFTDNEIRKSRQYSAKLEIEEEIKFPLVIKDVIMFDTDVYFFKMPNELLANLSRSRKIHYNFDIQREAVKKIQDGEVIQEVKLYMKNVNQIKENLKERTQERTALVINAAVRTGDNDELSYDPVNNTLTILSGSRLDIVDGMHRTKAMELATLEKPELKDEAVFGCWMLNFSDDRAARYQGQLSLAQPLAKERQEYLNSSRNSDLVIKELKISSELRGRISDDNVVRYTKNEVVSYRVLKDALEEQFKLSTKRDVYDTSDYLKKFFDYLLGYFEEEFIKNPELTNKTSIINTNNMFYAYLILARRMMELNIDPKNIIKYVSDIDFSRDNKLWNELGILDKEGNYVDTKKARKAIREYFETMNIE